MPKIHIPNSADEVCKEIPGFPHYLISISGKVWSKCRSKWLHSCFTNKWGHMGVQLGRGHKKHIHRLVLETFIGPCPKGMECRHLDGNPQNNNLSNLKWDTHINNMRDKKMHGTNRYNQCESNGRAKLSNDNVRMIVYMYRTGLFRIIDIAKLYKLRWQRVYQIITGRQWKNLWVRI